jgi:hypothetical protein
MKCYRSGESGQAMRIETMLAFKFQLVLKGQCSRRAHPSSALQNKLKLELQPQIKTSAFASISSVKDASRFSERLEFRGASGLRWLQHRFHIEPQKIAKFVSRIPFLMA